MKYPVNILKLAHIKSSHNRLELLTSDNCACFFCKKNFSPLEITEWTDNNTQDVGQTALCPRCGIDSVIGSSSGFPILDDAFLREMNQYYF
jgi:hypothetical protein